MPDTPILRCRNVWKLYGTGAEAARGLPTGDLDDAWLQSKGLIPAVRYVTLDIRKGEIFVSWACPAPASRRWCGA